MSTTLTSEPDSLAIISINTLNFASQGKYLGVIASGRADPTGAGLLIGVGCSCAGCKYTSRGAPAPPCGPWRTTNRLAEARLSCPTLHGPQPAETNSRADVTRRSKLSTQASAKGAFRRVTDAG